MEDKINDLWEAGQMRPELLTTAACREIHDSAYLLRRDGPREPHLFYKLRKKSSEANTEAGAQALRRTDQDA